MDEERSAQEASKTEAEARRTKADKESAETEQTTEEAVEEIKDDKATSEERKLMAKKQKKNFKRKSDFDNRPKYCKFTSLGIEEIDFKDIKLLKEYITETGKIIPW